MTLLDLQSHTKAIIEKILTSATQANHLKARGIYINAPIEKVGHSRSKGPVLVETGHNCHFAIGHDLAAKIVVKTEDYDAPYQD